MRIELKFKECNPDFNSSLAEVKESAQFGKYLVAKRRIDYGEIVCEEYPLMIGPSPVSIDTEMNWVCLTCYRRCGNLCKVCNWPICDTVCQKGVLHANNECRILSEKEVRFENSIFESMAVRILRCLLLRDNDPVKWELLMKHDAQVEKRLGDPYTKETREFVMNFLLNKCQLSQAFHVTTIERVMGILAINEFCLTNDYTRNALLIFHHVSYFTHSCVPNMDTIWKFHPTIESSYSQNYFSIKFFAARDIEEGEMLTHSYILDSGSVHKRQNCLAPYYFYCDCERCRVDLFNEIDGNSEYCQDITVYPAYPA